MRSSNFTSNSLVGAALRHGSAQDTVTVQHLHIARYAAAVSGSEGTVAVVVVGADVTLQVNSLHTLLVAIVRLGALVLLASMVAGYFLAGRALVPVEAAQKRQQDFIADASHELRTPLTLLRADAEVLLRNRNALPEEDAELLDDVVHEVDHMTGLADSMLQLARLDAGTTHIERDVVDLAQVAEEMGRRASARAAELGISITVDAAHQQLVLGDSLLINQAALALVDNALKYNLPGGSVAIDVHPSGDMVAFTVRDSGPGIAGEHIEHLGKRFYRVDKARSREMGGAGLGLSIVSRIAAQHGGKLSIQSEPGEGTAVTITFPRP
jgi:signal transduction histidine kinase